MNSSPISHPLNNSLLSIFQSSASSQHHLPVSETDGRLSCRSFTFSEGSQARSPTPTATLSPPPSRPRQLGRSESVGEECYGDSVTPPPAVARAASNGDGVTNNASGASSVGARSGPQAYCENEARDALAGLMESKVSSTLLPRTGQPYRSASFGQADLSRGELDFCLVL